VSVCETENLTKSCETETKTETNETETGIETSVVRFIEEQDAAGET